jgi:hypothetical protein
MMHQFNHRYASYDYLGEGMRSHMIPPVETAKLEDPDYYTSPCYYVPHSEVENRLQNHIKELCAWDRFHHYDSWIEPRVIELVYTAWDVQPFAIDFGYNCPPFRWNEERRFLLRSELDAAYFHLYGIERDDVDCIMETGEAYRTRLVPGLRIGRWRMRGGWGWICMHREDHNGYLRSDQGV